MRLTPCRTDRCAPLDPVVVPAAPFSPSIVSSTAISCRRRRSGPSTSPPATNIRSGRASIYVFTDWYHRSKIEFFLYRSVEFSDDQLLEGGLRIGYKTDRYDVAGFVRNITNDESAVSGIDFNNLTAMVNEPRIWGIELGVKF